jgi:hypothetical protein
MFDDGRFEDSTAIGADLSRASFRGTRLTETSFARAVLREAVFVGARGDGVEFRGADLRGATLAGAWLDEADFRGADLRNADLTGGRFRSADFRGALLDGARFDGADCQAALFDAGEGPRADARSAPRRPRAAGGGRTYDEAAAAAMRDAIAALPGLFAGGAVSQATATDLLGRLQPMIDALATASDTPPAEWKPLLEALIDEHGNPRPIDEKALRDLLSMLTPP